MIVDDAEVLDRTQRKGPARAWLRALELTAPIAQQRWRTFPAVIEELAARFADAPALLSDTEGFSFRALAERSNRYARWALAQHIGRGDTVCLMMPSRPEYMAIWLGITRVGGAVALVNTHLVGPSLTHCIDAVAPKHIIVAHGLLQLLEGARPHLAAAPRIWSHGSGDGGPFSDIAAQVAGFSGEPLGRDECPPVGIDDLALYVYTSGTTGLPKAARVSHYRLMVWTHWFAGMMETGPDDRMYNCLPMYHSIGGAAAIGAALVNGGAVAIREKFSASAFWDDIARFDCTLVQYIGELCRYLLHAPAHPRETRHRLRLACGNGLRADIWQEFKQRFRIPQILEFYAATEANISLFNVEGRPGSIGRTPSFMAQRTALALVKFDLERGAPVRNVHGFCIRCAPNEVGEAIGRISANQTDLGQSRNGKENPPRRVRARRCLVSHRRPHPSRRERILFLRRPHRRHLPLEGRERRDIGGGGGDHLVSRHRRRQCLWHRHTGHRRPRRDGGTRLHPPDRPCGVPRSPDAVPAPLRAPGATARAEPNQRHADLQADQESGG
jgi:fatty-acyl-CoA synthase